MAKAIILVLDSFGIGSAPDADKFGDAGANTFASIARAFANAKGRQLELPNLARLGLVKAAFGASSEMAAVADHAPVAGAYGYAAELSSGKDTPSGHWEIAGVPVLFDWGYFHSKQHSFPQELIEEIKTRYYTCFDELGFRALHLTNALSYVFLRRPRSRKSHQEQLKAEDNLI